MNFIDAFQNKTILIPLLQRDYVQGGKEDVINPFLDSLILSENQCDLNYIYGYTKTVDDKTCFIPVDGQQRLTTLWILHTYIFARKNNSDEFHVTLKFVAREFAQDFCLALQSQLQALLTHVNENDDLGTAIIDQPWFISSWYRNATVRNILNTLTYIHQKIKSDNIDNVWERLNSENKVSFAFLNMDESNGLDDDIYIKMNGRGRALSHFENLKSWMDEQISALRLSFSEDWKHKMDNEWTQLFWDNRNLSQDHPEEIDDEQLYCFNNMLLLYHVRRDDLLQTIKDLKEQQPRIYEELFRFLEIKNETAKEDDVLSAVFKWIQEADKFSLIWIERLNLMPEEFYENAYKWMNSLVKYGHDANNLNLYIGALPTDTNKKLYQLAMCKSSFERTLPLLYALVSYKGGNKTSLFDWMRTLRNLILNTSISREENLSKIMSAIDVLAEKAKDYSIYKILNEGLNMAFNGEQIKEESEKAKPESLLCYDEMVKMENGRFFAGRIGVLFEFLPKVSIDGYDTWSKENVIAYSEIMLHVFDGSKRGINTLYDEGNSYYLRRALMSYPPYYFGIYKRGWCFCSEMDDWRKYIRKKTEDKSLRLLIMNILSYAYKNGGIDNLIPSLEQYVEKISKEYESDITKEDDNTYRFHFIHHPGVWSYISNSQCVQWNDDNYFDIILKHSVSNNSNRMELRTYCLYLDYKYNSELRTYYNGWGEPQLYQREGSCFYFDKTMTIEGKDYTLRIDVKFKRESENSYFFDMRTLHNDDTGKSKEQNEIFFGKYFPMLLKDYSFNKNGRLVSQQYSRKEVIDELKKIMDNISQFEQLSIQNGK